MAKRKSNVADFGSVSNDVNVKNKGKNNEKVNDENKTYNDLNNILEDNERKEKEYVMKGIHMRKDLAKILDKKSKGKRKGTMSLIVNQALEKAFKEAGWLK